MSSESPEQLNYANPGRPPEKTVWPLVSCLLYGVPITLVGFLTLAGGLLMAAWSPENALVGGFFMACAGAWVSWVGWRTTFGSIRRYHRGEVI